MTRACCIVLASIVALLGACTPSKTDSSATREQAQAIRAALEADAAASAKRNQETKYISPSLAMTDYVVALDAIDLGATTPAFEAAFIAHRDAWNATIGPLRQRSSERGEMHDMFDRLTAPSDPMHETFQRLIDEVWATWADVEAAARAAGVKP